MIQDTLLKKEKDDKIELVNRNVVDSKLYDTLLNSATLENKRKFVKNTRKNRNVKNKVTKRNKRTRRNK